MYLEYASLCPFSVQREVLALFKGAECDLGMARLSFEALAAKLQEEGFRRGQALAQLSRRQESRWFGGTGRQAFSLRKNCPVYNLTGVLGARHSPGSNRWPFGAWHGD